MKGMTTNILLADDHGIAREGLTSLIKDVIADAQFFHAIDFNAALQQLRETPMHLTVCDINMPGGNNFGIVDSIREVQPGTKILIFSAYKNELYGARYLQAGADAYLDKNVANSKIQETILSLIHYKSAPVIDNATLAGVTSPLAKLSDRELEVAQLLTSGLGILEVSNSLDIRSTTVSTYKKRIYEKLGVDNIPDLVTMFNNYA
jgi:two-component system invasion response regulator UvrY